VGFHLVPWLRSLVIKDTEWLGLDSAPVEQMGHGQATQPFVTVSDCRPLLCDLHIKKKQTKKH